MDERSFDNLVRELATSVQSRRTLALSAVGLGLSLISPPVGEADAAPRRQGKRQKNGKPDKGKKPHGGHKGDCEQPSNCPRDPKTGKRGFLCSDGLCTCGGKCCEKGYACFVGSDPAEEVCCFDDAAAIEVPKDVEFAVCPGAPEPRDTCCKATECDNGECRTFTPGRYRRNPR